MEEWEKYFDEGLAYCKVAIGAKEKKKLGNTVIYNTVGLAVESLLMAVLAKNGVYPEHSSISFMLRESKKFFTVPEEFFAEVRFMNSLMNFCSLEVAEVRIPTDSEVDRMTGFVASLRDWATINLRAA
jgi:Uncharacterized conserved protein related to C-terminal domain of eukaryotic chaperone, SACSIN